MKLNKNEILAVIVLAVVGGSLFIKNLSLDAKNPAAYTPTVTPAKPDHFKRLSASYVTDGTRVYMMSGVGLEGFQVIDGDLIRDTNGVYYNGKRLSLSPDKLQLVKNKDGDTRAVYDKYGTFYILGRYPLMQVPGISTSTFVFLDGGPYIKDKNHVYYMNFNYEDSKVNVMKDADPATFKVAGTCEVVETSHASYAIDKNNVYVEDKVVPGADAATFTYLGYESSYDGEVPAAFSWAKDKNHIYYNCGDILKGVDHDSFEFTQGGKAHDKYKTFNVGEFSASGGN